MVLARVAEYLALKDPSTPLRQDERHGPTDTSVERTQQNIGFDLQDDDVEEARPAYSHVCVVGKRA